MLALAGLVVGLLGAGVILGSDHLDHRGLTATLLLGIGVAWIGTGLYAWARRPTNRIGALMTWTGFAWLLSAFVAADSPAVFTVAVLGSNLYLAAFVHLLVAYPEGRVRRPAHRRLVAAAYAIAIVGPAPYLMFGFEAHCTGCPRSVLQVSAGTTVGTISDALATGIAVALIAYLVFVLTGRWRAASPARRRTLAPLLWSGVVLMILAAGSIGAQTVAGNEDDVSAALMLLGQIVFASVPFTFLAGLLRSRVAQADAVGALLVRLGEAPGTDGLRGLLAEALDDPGLQVLYWVEGDWVRRDGQAAEIPADQAWTAVELEGQRVGASVHDRSLRAEPEVLSTVAAAAGLALRSERLEAALRRSRARIANAATVAVRRINGHACVEIRDDGVGGADPGRGSGLRGLADRVGALDGSLALDSPPGSGTTLRAEIPV